MGLLQLFKNAIDTRLGILHVQNENEILHLFKLIDEQGYMADSFRLSKSTFNNVYGHVSSKQRCIVQDIETVTDNRLYNVHAKDQNGKARTFKMKRVT